MKIFSKFRKITTNINQLNFRTLKSLKPPTRPTQTAATPTRPTPVTIHSLTTISAAHSPLTPIPFRSTRSSDFAANSPKLPCATSLRTRASAPKSARHSERLFENCEILKQNYNNCQTSFTNLKLRTALQSCENQSNLFEKKCTVKSHTPYGRACFFSVKNQHNCESQNNLSDRPSSLSTPLKITNSAQTAPFLHFFDTRYSFP